MGRPKETNSQSAVAEATGIAKPIVCRVLNGDPRVRVSAATRARILETARRLGYDGRRKLRGRMRETPRRHVSFGVGLEVRIGGRTVGTGTATMSQLNTRGCRLSSIALAPPSFPAEPFELAIRIDGRETVFPSVVVNLVQ